MALATHDKTAQGSPLYSPSTEPGKSSSLIPPMYVPYSPVPYYPNIAPVKWNPILKWPIMSKADLFGGTIKNVLTITKEIFGIENLQLNSLTKIGIYPNYSHILDSWGRQISNVDMGRLTHAQLSNAISLGKKIADPIISVLQWGFDVFAYYGNYNSQAYFHKMGEDIVNIGLSGGSIASATKIAAILAGIFEAPAAVTLGAGVVSAILISWGFKSVAKKTGGQIGDFIYNITHQTSPQVGGILFDKCLTAVGELPNIFGAYWDDKKDALILLSNNEDNNSNEVKLSGLEFDHLHVALRAALAGEHLGVSIDPPSEYRDGINRGTFPPTGTPMYVSYLGNTEGTLFGAIMFEADRVMKCLSKGTDNKTGLSFRAKNVKGYKTLFELFNAFESGKSGSWFRFWFVIDTIEIAHDKYTKAFRFEKVKIKVLNEAEIAGGEKSKEDPASKAFAEHLSEFYDEYAKEFPILNRLKEIAKISALARFLVNQGIEIDNQTIFKHAILPVATPETTPGIVVSHPSNSGGSQLIFGGVDMDVDPVITGKDDKIAQTYMELAQNACPGDSFSSWNFNGPGGSATASAITLSGVKKPYRAISNSDHAFLDTWKKSIRSIRRYYDSSIPSGDFGPGWCLFLPFRLQVFPKSMKRAEVLIKSEKNGGSAPSVIILHNYINPGSNVYRRFKDADKKSDIAYCRITHQTLLNKSISFSVKQSDVIYFQKGTYSLTDDNYTYQFDGTGQLIEIKTLNGTGLFARYTWESKLLREIEYGSGKKYSIEYENEGIQRRIIKIVASDGVLLNYNYANGLLSECIINNSKKVSYRYDQQNRISETRNGDGIVVKRTVYDSNGNVSNRPERCSTLSDNTELQKYFSDSRIQKVHDESGGVAEYKYYECGSLASISMITDKKEKVVLSYAQNGKITSVKDMFGKKHKIVYHPDGQIRRVEGDDGSWVELPMIDNISEDILGSNGFDEQWKVKRNSLGLPEEIINSHLGNWKFKYNKNGLASIGSPIGNMKISHNNGITEFKLNNKTKNKQNISFDSINLNTKISSCTKGKKCRDVSITKNGYTLNDCAGSADYQFDQENLTCDVLITGI